MNLVNRFVKYCPPGWVPVFESRMSAIDKWSRSHSFKGVELGCGSTYNRRITRRTTIRPSALSRRTVFY